MQKKIRKVMSVFMVSALLFSGCGIHGTDNVKKEGVSQSLCKPPN